MRLHLILCISAFAFAANGCGSAAQLAPLNDKLNSADTQLSNARKAGADTASIEQQLAQVSRDASADAQSAKDPKDAVAFYRVAAVAAWQAGPAGSNLVLPATTAGITACEALPQHDKDAPRDCSLIRLALPMAVQDAIALQLIDLKKKRTTAQSDHDRHCQELQGAEAAACRSTRGKLPATDLPSETTMFGDLETQFGKVSDLRDGLHNLDVPPAFTPQTDAQRLIVYCNAVIAWRLTADTDADAGAAQFAELTSRKAAMAQRLEASGVAADCTPVLSMQTTPPM